MSPDPTRTSPPASGQVPTATDGPAPPGSTASHVPADTTRDDDPASLATPHHTGPGPGGVPGVAGYEILGELGRGGMGVVYKARDTRLNRTVALKMILRGPDGSAPRAFVRFLAEAEAVAAVRHPNVVQVYEAGESGGHPFLALEFLPGGSLTDRLTARLTPSDALALVGKVAAGVAAAHEAGVVHRDLKPGNVLFDAAGEPKVTDFGLAKRAAREDLTQTGAILGTPQYMAPEQASGGAKFVGPQADVWALGVILYECLAGCRPFRAGSGSELLYLIRTADPPSLRTHAPGVPMDVELVCAECLEKNPADRYPTAAELAADLDRLARGEPISIRPAGLLERAYKWAKRKPTVAALYALSSVAAVLLVFGGVVAWLWRDSETARRDAEEARGKLAAANAGLDAANQKLGETNQQLAAANEQIAFDKYAANMDLAARDYDAMNLPRTLELLADCPERFRGWEWWYLRRLCNQYTRSYQLDAPPVAVTPDRRSLVVRGPGGLKLVRVATGEAYFSLPGVTPADAATVVSPDGSRVAVEGPGQTARVYDVASGKELVPLPEPVVWATVAFSPDGTRLVAADRGGGVLRVRDAADGRVLHTLTAEPPSRAERALYSPDGKWIVAATQNARVHVWAAAGTLVRTVTPPADGGVGLAFVGRGDRFAAWSGIGVVIYDTATGRGTALITGKYLPPANRPFVALTASPDGKWVATLGGPGVGTEFAPRVWDAGSGQLVATCSKNFIPTMRDIGSNPVALEFGADSSRLLTFESGVRPYAPASRARVWTPDARRGPSAPQPAFTLEADLSISSAWFAAEPGRVITTDPKGRVCVWDTAPDPRFVNVAPPPGGGFADPPLSRDGRRVVGVDRSGAPVLWDVATGAPVTNPGELAAVGPVRRLVTPRPRPNVADDGRVLSVDLAYRPRAEARAAGDGEVLVHDPAHRPRVVGRRFPGARSVAASPDGSRLAVLGADGVAGVHTVPSGDELARLDRNWPGRDVALAFTFDGRHVTARLSDTAVFDAATGRLLFTVRDTDRVGDVRLLTVSPDGRRAVAVHADGNLRVWDTRTDKLVLTFQLRALTDGSQSEVQLTPPQSIAALAFTPDGRRLVLVSAFRASVLDAAPAGAPDGWKP